VFSDGQDISFYAHPFNNSTAREASACGRNGFVI
jgi:hypothetical protein